MLNRLRGEGLLSQDDYEEYSGYSPSALARSLGLDAAEYVLPREGAGISLGTYPPSVLQRVQRMIRDGDLTPAGAADLLQVSQEEILDLLRVETANDAERHEFDELPVPAAPRTKRGAAAR